MQVPVIDRLNHLQAGLDSLQKQQSPSSSSSFLSHIQSASIAFDLCKWGALILALLATFRTIIKTLNVLIIPFRQNAPSLSSIPLLYDDDDDDYSDTADDDDDEVTCSSPLSSEFEDEDEDDAGANRTGECFRVRGSGDGDGGFLRRRSIGDLFSLSEIANSKSVVKLWDTIGFGLGFGLDHSSSSDVVSVYEGQRIRPVPTGKPPTPAVSCVSPAVVVSAGENGSGNLGLRIWDTRLRRRIPAVIAEWGPTSLGRTVGVEAGGVQKVYVRDDGRYGLTVGDMRNVRSPLENVTESHVDAWWPNSFMLKI